LTLQLSDKRAGSVASVLSQRKWMMGDPVEGATAISQEHSMIYDAETDTMTKKEMREKSF